MSSKIGWIVSIVLVLAVAGGVVIKLSQKDTSAFEPDRTADPEMLEMHTVSADPTPFVGPLPSGAGDAGEDYAAAVKIYDERLGLLMTTVDAIDQGRTPPPEGLQTLQEIHRNVEAGAGKRDMRYLFVQTAKELPLQRRIDQAQDFAHLATAMEKLARHYVQQDRIDAAEEVLAHEFLMGRRLAASRELLPLVKMGFSIQNAALARLEGLYKEQPGAERKLSSVKAYREELFSVQEWFTNKAAIIWSTTPHAGDLINIAENDADPVWRKEAVRMIGVARWTSGNEEAVKRMNEILAREAKSDDPVMAEAAKVSSQTTERIIMDIGRNM